jgi:hypothetical protein
MRTRAIWHSGGLRVLLCSILILDALTLLIAQHKQEPAGISKSLQVTGVLVATDGTPLFNTTTRTYVFLVLPKNGGYGIELDQNERALNPFTEANAKGEFTLVVPPRVLSSGSKDFALVVSRVHKVTEGIEASLPMINPEPSERRAPSMVALVALGAPVSCAPREGFPSSTLTFAFEGLSSRLEPINLGQITLKPRDTAATVDCTKLTGVLNRVSK